MDSNYDVQKEEENFGNENINQPKSLSLWNAESIQVVKPRAHHMRHDKIAESAIQYEMEMAKVNEEHHFGSPKE